MDHDTPKPIIDKKVRELLAPYDEIGLFTLAYDPARGLLEFSEECCERLGVEPLWTDVPDSIGFLLDPEDREACSTAFRSVSEGAERSIAVLRLSKARSCVKLTLRPAERDASGMPTLVIGCVDDIGGTVADHIYGHRIRSLVSTFDKEVDTYATASSRVAATLGTGYDAIYRIDLADATYTCFREELPGIMALIPDRGAYQPAWDTYINTRIVEADRAEMRAFTDIATLPTRLAKVGSIEREYRRTDVGWTRGQFVVAERGRDGMPTHLLYTALDVNAEHERSERERRALYAATHDSLTSALNRDAYEGDLARGMWSKEPVAFLLVDIDNFKDLNDMHGHEFGDTVIRSVSSELMGCFQDSGRVYRIGGDEFAIALRGCTPDDWEPITRKLRLIHVNLAEALRPTTSVTLSAGACFGNDGLESWMCDAADTGLYAAKRSGRAGCALVDPKGTTLDTWKDTELSENATVAMALSNTGTGRFEVLLDGSRPSKLFCGKALRTLYGIPADASPEECFRLWRRGVDPSHMETLRDAAWQMVTSDNVECSFLWHHPAEGPFLVRTIGSAKVAGPTMTVYTLHRSLRGAKVIESDVDSHLILEAQDAINFCSIYCDVQTGRIIKTKLADPDHARAALGLDARKLLETFLANDVREQDREAMRGFLDLGTLEGRIGGGEFLDHEYESTTSKGWCRARWLPVRRGDKGELLRALFCIATVDAAMQERINRDLEVARLMNLHYNAAEAVLDTKILGITLLDLKTNESRSWSCGPNGLVPDERTYEECLATARAWVAPAEREAYDEALARDRVLAEVSRHGSYIVPMTFHHEDGATQYVTHRFRPYRLDPTSVIAVIEDETATHVPKGLSVNEFFEGVPAGLATVDWDGREFEVVNVSVHYRESYGWGIVRDQRGIARPDFMRIHQADRADYVTKFLSLATRDTEMHHICRMWNAGANSYSWIKMDAVSRPGEAGHTLIYAAYSDVTDLVEARRDLAMADESLNAALAATSQLLYEYDPLLDIATCVTRQNYFGLPSRIENCIVTLRDCGLFHPADAHVFFDCIAKMETGDERSQCDLRIKGRDGAYRWYSCLFNWRHDEGLGRDLIVILVVDVTLRVLASEATNARAKAIFEPNEDVLAVTNFDLTNDRVTCVRARDGLVGTFAESSSYDAAVRKVAANLIDPDLAGEFHSVFGRDALLAAYAAGVSKTTREGLYRVAPHRTEWLETTAELYPNHATGNVVGVAYSQIMTVSHLTGLLLDEWLAADYPAAAIVLDGGREFFLFDRDEGALCAHRHDFWDSLEQVVARTVGTAEAHRVVSQVDPDAVLAATRSGARPEFRFEPTSGEKGPASRHVLRFALAQADDDIIICSLRAIPDDHVTMSEDGSQRGEGLR